MTVPPEVLFFDVNESLSDMAPVMARCTDLGVPAWVGRLWFTSVLRDGFALAATGAAPAFADIARGNLAPLLLAHGRDPASVDADVAHVLSAFPELDVHPDVPDGVRALHAAGVRLFTLVVGSPVMTLPMFERAGIHRLFEGFLGPEEVGAWKPTPRSYLRACELVGVDPDRAMLLATHPWDINGAQQVGITGVWIRRGATSYPHYLPRPDAVVDTVGEVAALMQ